MNIFKRITRDELPFILAWPGLMWQLFFVYLPLAILLFYSLWNPNLNSFLKISFDYYIDILLDTMYFKVLMNSLVLALLTSTICFFIAYPVAYFFAIKVKKFKTFLLFSLILPSWTSFVVQIYAWFFLLQKKGFLSIFLYKIGILSINSHLLNNYFAILLGMVYCFLPFMILPIYTILEKMDKKLLEASADLGANQYETFKRIILPISFPGIIAGFLLVFIPSFGEFAIPDLLGGGKNVFWGSIIVDKFLMSRNWQYGAALTIIGIMFLTLSLYFIVILQKIFKRIIRANI